jgi:phosphate transport system substrate-binding protein
MTTFGGSDMPLSKEELDKAGLVQFPIAMAGDVPIVNIKEIKSGDLVLDGPTLAKIYLGQVVKWDDPSIRKLNPNLLLPSIPIIVIRRADGSGTSFIWTDYLSKVSEVWERTVGSGTEVNWPIGIGGIGNDGVMKNVQNFRGSIGYVEFAYARRNKLNSVSVINKEGKVVLPNFDSFSAAAANVNWKSLNRYFVFLTNQPGEQTWPISGATFILMQKRLINFDDTVSALKFFLWAYNHGETYARELNYAPMPAKAISEIKATWKSEFPSEVIKAINLN